MREALVTLLLHLNHSNSFRRCLSKSLLKFIMDGNNSTSYFDQVITFNSSAGPTEVPLPVIDQLNLYNIKICINYGSQIGASMAVLVVLLLLTKPEKRLSAIMVINTLSLIFNIIRNVLQCLFFTGPFAELYASLIGDFSRVHTSNYAMSVTATICTLLMQICVETSLCLQVRVVCVTLRERYRRLIFASSLLIAVVAVGCRFAYVVENDFFILTDQYPTRLLKLGMATNYATAASIFWFCAIFVTKLGYALRQRTKMGLGQFGPMQILFIMGCQTLIIPGRSLSSDYHITYTKTQAAVFSILQCWDISPAMNSNALTACAIFLPLSSLWASASIGKRSQASKESRDKFANYPPGFSDSSTYRKTSTGPVSPSTTATTLRVSAIGSGPISPKEIDEHQVYMDLEKQDLAANRDSKA